MPLHRAHILLPEDLITEIDALVGPRRRSSFLVETTRAELRRRKLLSFLESTEPAWQERDHPELADDADTWVRKLRAEGDTRLPRVKAPHKSRARKPGTK